MTYRADDARREMLDTIAEAIERLAVAIAALGAAYELLDEHGADRLEDELFRPLQGAYAQARRTHAAFGARHGLPPRSFAAAPTPGAARRVPELLENASSGAIAADALLSELQDSMRPVDVGDAELRAGLAEVRAVLADVPGRTRRLAGVLGR